MVRSFLRNVRKHYETDTPRQRRDDARGPSGNTAIASFCRRAEVEPRRGGRPIAGEAITGNAVLPVFTLADLGVDKKLSARSQRLAALPGKRFEIVTQRLLSFPTKVSYERPSA